MTNFVVKHVCTISTFILFIINDLSFQQDEEEEEDQSAIGPTGVARPFIDDDSQKVAAVKNPLESRPVVPNLLALKSHFYVI